MSAALAIVEEASGEEAVRQAVRLVVIEGGAAATAGEAAGSAAAIGVGGILAATGVGLAVVGLAALGYYLYEEHQAPAARELVAPCPKVAASTPTSDQVAAIPSSASTNATSAPAYGRKDRKCNPGDCERAKKAIRDLLREGLKKPKTLRKRFDQLRDNPEGQPYDYPVDPVTGERPPPEGGTVSAHLEEIIRQTERGGEAIQTYYQCRCTGLDESEIRELGDVLLEDPLEGVKQKEPNYRTPAERLDWRRRMGRPR